MTRDYGLIMLCTLHPFCRPLVRSLCNSHGFDTLATTALNATTSLDCNISGTHASFPYYTYWHVQCSALCEQEDTEIGPGPQTRETKVLSILVAISVVGTISGKYKNCCHQMSYFKGKMHKIRLRLGLCPRPYWGAYCARADPLAGFKGRTSKGKEGREGRGTNRPKGEEKGKGKGSGGEGRGSTWPGPTFSSVYATPLLQHQAQLGLNPDLHRRHVGR